jgi:hypothetical protein
MAAAPTAEPATHATINFQIVPPAGNSDLAVTFYFTETPGGFLRVYWTGVQGGEMLSDNLFEGIGMPNQRTLLIKRGTLSTPGTLTVQSSETSLYLSRIHWEWVEPSTVSLADAAKQAALVTAAGAIFGEGEVNGAPLLPPPDQVGKSVVTANLTDKPERIEKGVEFIATLQGVPQYARLEVKMSGVPLDKPVQLWVNGAQAGEVSMEVPDLNDPGYRAAAGAPPVYIGWRKGVIYLPAGALKLGDNQFQFAVKDATAVTPLAVKDLQLQLKYEYNTANTPTAAPSEAPDVASAETAPAPTPAPGPVAGPTPVPAVTNASPGLIFYRYNGSTTLR